MTRAKTPGVVAAGDPQTAEAGAAILRAGGTAVDAVCAASFAAFVAETPLCSPAGGGALLHGNPRSGFHCLDFFAAAPGLGLPHAPPDDFFAVDVDFGPTTQRFHVGRGAAAVPGALLGLLTAHQRAGRLPLAEVVAPAIELARSGYVLSAGLHYIVSILEPIIGLTPATRRVFGAERGIPAAGTTITNPAIADFFEAVADGGEAFVRHDFHRDLLAEFGPEAGGRISAEDLERYQPIEREPLAVDVAGHRVLTNPPPSSGGALVALGLRLAGLEPGLGDPRAIDGRSARHVSEIAAVLQTLSVVRSKGYDQRIQDPAARDGLFSDAALAELHATHAEHRAEHPLGSTTHISVLDALGEAASLTMSNGEGCGHTLARWGVHVNNFLGEEDINPGGFHRWPAGARMTTMMAPTIVLRDGDPVYVLGSGGSNRIRSALLQVLLATLVGGRSIVDAVQAPRLHVEGPRLWFESCGLEPEAVQTLREFAEWTEFEASNMFFGGVHAAAREQGELHGAGDPRRGGAVAIVE